ncbi:uncharacterized mitochondrial protein AtMg00810-like [Helianthus annuus]|uniref:uncharacterized mitochondrial protein AtMg00810-like n=1 Tax=Helianthus annuus TaxID=4232 RepID=UPI001653400B|nr:uncharacterized mitochondrial protein AtMg00810-like [Helianthus annuus]
MYLTASRPDIMYAVCQCSRYQANPKLSHLTAIKRIFRYLSGAPKLGLWYPRDSNFILFAFSDSHFGGTDRDMKSTLAGCQFLGDRLISWQCKKQQTVSLSTAEAEYVAASACCSQKMLEDPKKKIFMLYPRFIQMILDDRYPELVKGPNFINIT